ncbi:MAG: CARDB domain-containing protein [Thermoproteota archaeon]
MRLKDRKPMVLCLIVLTMLLVAENWPVAYAQEPTYESVAILLNNVKSATYRFSDSDGDAGEIGFQVLGEEAVGGENTWKVEWTLKEEDESPEKMTLWISKSTGKCLQAEMEGETYTGYYAETFGNLMLYVWVAWVGTWVEAWNFTTVYDLEAAGYGRLVFLGPELRTLGPSQLLVYKWRWEGFRGCPGAYNGTAEWWFAPVSFGTLVVKIYLETFDKSEWWQLELLSIELVAPQPRPNIGVEVTIDKERLTPDEEATITATASNTGDAMGAHNLTVIVNGESVASKLIVLNPGESYTMNFKLSFSEEGRHSLSVGDKTFTITVSTTLPARFEVSSLSISPGSIKVGQSTTVSVSVKNTGGESGSYEVILKVNNQVAETKTGTLGSGQSVTVSFSYTPASEGTYSIDVNGLTGSLTVSKEETIEQGVPWFIIIGAVVAIAAIAMVILFLFLRKKPAPQPTYPPPPPPPPPPS